MKQTTIAQTAKQLTPTETSLVQTIAQSNTKAAFEAQCIRYLTHGEEYQIQLPPLPNLSGFEGMTGVGDGSPEALADDIRNNSVSDNELSVRTTQAVQYYLQQDSTQQEAIDFLTELDTRLARTMLLGAYMQQGDTALVRHYRLLLDADTVVNAYLKDYYKLLELVVKDGRSLYDLTEQEIVEFEELAVNDNTVAATYIQSLLAIPRLQTYDRTPQPIGQSAKRPNQTSLSQKQNWFYPNPATHSIRLKTVEPWQRLTLYNLYGQVQASYINVSEAYALPIGLANGIYILSLQLSDGNVKTGKLFISK
ncbi:MAG: T9SS type A sorting domain-containing protein [Sphingobacteriales bacterium]|nr:MAG: T9SS type A sorting domain-containing protein [Sphingobacteriales bacterium]